MDLREIKDELKAQIVITASPSDEQVVAEVFKTDISDLLTVSVDT